MANRITAAAAQAVAHVKAHKRAYGISALVLAVVAGYAYSRSSHAQVLDPGSACPATAAVDGACVRWTLPTQNEDGSAIPATGELALTEVQISRSVCKADNSAGTEVQLLRLAPTATSMFISGLPPATHCFRLRVRNGAALDADAFSKYTGAARKTTTKPAPPKPKQPTIVVS